MEGNTVKKKQRVASFVGKGQYFIEKGDTAQAIKEVEKGLDYYTKTIMESINPYSKQDAGLVVIALRHLANQIEKNNEGTKEFVEELTKILKTPEFYEMEKIEKPNTR